MRLVRNSLSAAVRLGVVLGTTGLAMPVVAQDDAPEQTLDRIQVTGSRIRQVDVETAQPILSISRQEIEKQGFKSVADILQNLTAAGTPALSRSSPLSSGEDAGGYFIDLRNLGAQRTLVLVNGKRLGISTSGLQDIASIPSSIVERIDVLKDGASSLYGSDAIAGVINIITRTNYTGAEANAYMGEYGEGDGRKQTYDFVLGISGDRGSLTTSVEYAKEEGVWARDRWFSKDPRYPGHPDVGWTTVGQFGRFQQGGRWWVLNDDGNPTRFADFHQQDTTPVTGDVSNPSEQMHVLTPVERRSLFVDGSYEVTDGIAFRTDILYSKRESERQVAGYPVQSSAIDTPMSIDSYFNPVGNRHGFATPQAVSWTRRTWEMPRVSSSDLTTYRFTGAFEGAFMIGDTYWNWDAGAMLNGNDLVQVTTGNLSIPNVAAAVGPSFLNANGVVQCGTAANPIPFESCMPFNPLLSAGQPGQGSLTGDPAVANYLFPTEQALGSTDTTNYFANLTGTLFSLPAGDLAAAVGYEYRSEKGMFSPDALSQSGSSTNLAGGTTTGGYSIDEFYAELDVPLLADLPFARELSVNVSSRYSDFTTFGDTVNSKAGIKWRPIEDLLVRGTWSEGFRAPTVGQLYFGGSQSFEFFTDPCDTLFGNASTNANTAARCAQDVPQNFRQLQQGFTPASGPGTQTPVPFDSVASPNLQPETSTSRTVGIVYSPGFVEGLNIAADWWKIRIDNTQIGDGVDRILEDCYVRGIESRCELFTRHATLGYVDSLSFGEINAGYVETEGFDLDLSYRLDTDIGRFDVNWANTYVSKNNLFTAADAAVEEPQVSWGGNFRIRSNLGVSWELGDFGVSWGARYYSAMKEACYFDEECNHPDFAAPDTGEYPMHRRGSNTFHDLQVRWNAPWNATIAAGANNVTNHAGPAMYSRPNSGFSYYGGFDIGRFWYVKYQQRF
jgi:iron complex outermembrane receptor protein